MNKNIVVFQYNRGGNEGIAYIKMVIWIGRQMDWHVLQSDLAGQSDKSVWCKGENGEIHSF